MNWSIGFFGQPPSPSLLMTHFSSIPWERGTFMFVCVSERENVHSCVYFRMCVMLTPIDSSK